MMNVVLVGCGAMSKAWLEAGRDRRSRSSAWSISTLSGPRRARANSSSRARDRDEPRCRARAGRADTVFDVVVPAARRDVAISALRHDCHLLTEKPLADSSENARAIVEPPGARSHPCRRAEPPLRRQRQAHPALPQFRRDRRTDEHSCDFFVAPHFGGFREEMRHVLLLDMAIHTFDAARYMVNGEPRRVYCQEWEPANSWYRQGSSADAIFEIGGGKMFTYRGSWCADGFADQLGSGWRIVGERGSLIWDGYDELRAEAAGPVREGLLDRAEPLVVPPLDPTRPRRRPSRRDPGFRRAPSRAAPSRKRAEATTSRASAMVFGAIESAETGRRVEIAA